MRLAMRGYESTADLGAIAELIGAAPPMGRHLIDFPWRLSAHAPGSPDLRLWAAADGVLVGFAAWQQWWATLDCYVRPGPAQREVDAAIFDWAQGRFQELDAARGRPLPYWAEAREDDGPRLALLARHGYTLDDDYTYVTLSRPLADAQAPPLPRPHLPAGFAIRPLAGTGEVDAYVAAHRRAFASTSMTAAWRERTLRMPHYEPESTWWPRLRMAGSRASAWAGLPPDVVWRRFSLWASIPSSRSEDSRGRCCWRCSGALWRMAPSTPWSRRRAAARPRIVCTRPSACARTCSPCGRVVGSRLLPPAHSTMYSRACCTAIHRNGRELR